MKSPSARLRELLDQERMVIAPGVYDGLTARLVEQAGFKAAYMTGAGTSAARGFPDYGLLTATEMIENAATIARSISIPLIADADTGYGNELNATRTVQDFESRGVAGIHIEDQVSPKKCGHLDGKEVISRDAFASKIRAAANARRTDDFLLIARTDARAVNGVEDAVDRANAALDAGADMVFVEALQSIQELESVPIQVRGPCLLNVVPGGKTPAVTRDQAEAMGYRLAILPGVLLRSVFLAVDRTLAELAETGLPEPILNSHRVSETFRRLGSDQWDSLRREYAE